MKQTELKNINKIGIVMFGLLGDVLMRTPIIEAIRQLYPNAEITAICDASTQAVLRDNAKINNFIVFDKKNKNSIKKTMSKLKGFLSVRQAKYDLLIDLYNGGSSSFIVRISKARYRLGYDHQKNKKFYNLFSDGLEQVNTKIHSYNASIMSILKPLSAKTFSLYPQFFIDQATVEKMAEYKNNFINNGQKIYILNLGAGGEEKLLDTAKYFEIVKYIYEKYGYIAAIVRNPSQEFLQEQLIKEYLLSTSIEFIKLKPLSIGEIAALIKLSAFIITPDTGLMHLAFSQNAFVYTPFTYTNPDLVDINNDKFIPVSEHFDPGVFGQTQKISIETLLKNVDTLFQKISYEK